MSVKFQIEEVADQLSKQNFLELSARLYQNELNWIGDFNPFMMHIGA